MKKIILIDDNKMNQRSAYGASFVDDGLYADSLLHIEKVNVGSDFSFLNNAACVMIHDSLEDYINGEFDAESHKAKELIEIKIKEYKIPYVFFSDGHGRTAVWRDENPDVVYEIKKSEFYLHLNDFMQEYADSGNLDLRIIAYGKDYKKKLMSDWHQTVFSALTDICDNEVLDISLFDNQMRKALRLIIENAQPKIGISFNSLMCDIEDEKITAGQFRMNLNKIINSVKNYGKNIYCWN